MPINKEATLDDDLTTLGPVELLRTIQGLLLQHSSDQVREKLKRVNLDEAIIPRSDNTSFTIEDFLESPFFIAKNLKELPDQVQPPASDRRLSGNVSQTARGVLKDFYSYNVAFDKWVGFEPLMAVQDISSLATLPENMHNWGMMVRRLLSLTSASNMGKATGEVQELTIMHGALRDVFLVFDFSMDVKNGSDDDVTCSILSTPTDFMFTEGKESSCLPRRLFTDGHHLCLFGFATKLARIQWTARPGARQDWHDEAKENNTYRAGLQQFLEVGGVEPSMYAHTSVRPSAKTNAILRRHSDILAHAAGVVHANFASGMIEPHDAVNLWAAVMQACHYSINKGRAMTIVQSARMWWFIHLSEQQDHSGDHSSCVVRISEARKVGSRHFLTIVMQFLSYAHRSPLMEQGPRRRWETAIASASSRSTRASMEPTVATINEEMNNGGDIPSGQKRHRPSPTGTASSLSHAEQKCCASTATPTVSFDKDETYSCFGYDEFGMQIPWFDQIGDTLEVLGQGRSGKVTKVVWNAQPVALKTFILQSDDSRSLESVYEHELEVLWELRELWGKHVPKLLFHKPWPTSPMIGLELGEPFPDDMSTWSDTDREKAKESVQKIKELGWYQEDVRGLNFVRLRGNKIALIDFESMAKVSRDG
jgi:hypothetical protein